MSGPAVVALLLSFILCGDARCAEPLPIREDGWYTWNVAGDSVVIYARIVSGRPAELRLPGHHCPPRPLPDAVELGSIPAAGSVDWLRRFVTPRSGVSREILAALSAHESALAVDALLAVLGSDPDRQNRLDALFWLAQSRSAAAFAALDHLLR